MHRLICSFVVCAFIIGTAIAQESKNAPPYVPPKPALTPDQVANVLKQLDDIEKNIMAQRGTNLSAIIQKLRAAASTDLAAFNFVAECEKLVTVDRKDADRKEALRLAAKKDSEKRDLHGPDATKEGDMAAGLRLCLEYLALTLEARDVKDLATMTPKITSFYQNMLALGKKIKGKTGELLMQPIGSGGGGDNRSMRSVVEAYQLEQYLKREDWSNVPGDIVAMYDKVIIENARKKKREDMASLWDAALNTEVAFSRLRMADGEFAVWEKSAYPDLRWQRATDLAVTGPNPVTGMAEMLKVIKDYPGHPNSPDWVKQLRTMVTPAKPEEGAEKTSTAAAQ